MTASSAILSMPKAPFRGLRPFRYIDSPIFFARDSEAQKLLQLITIYRAVLLYGDSGTGKSSLVRAGLIPRALDDGFLPETLRIQPRLGEEFIVERILCREGDPANYLPSSLAPEDNSARSVLSAEEFTTRIQSLNADRIPLLIVDQFEEWVTLADSDNAQPAENNRKAQDRILDALVAIVRDHSIPVKLLFVFREDYFAKFNQLFLRCPYLVDQYLRLTSLPTSALMRIVRGPFTLAEMPEKYWGSAISESLAQQIRQEIEDREQSALNLSEIQVVSLKLWISGDPDDLYRRRKISGILEDFLASSLADLGPLETPSVALLSRMVTSSGTRNVVSGDDLLDRTAKEAGIAHPLLLRALEALVDETKLVNKEIRNETYFYEIVSEFLVPWIFQQKRKLIARATRARLLKRVLLAAIASLVVLAVAGLWYREKNTEAALRDSMVSRLESQNNALDRLLKVSTDSDAFKKESYAQLSRAQSERDSLKVELSTVQAERNSLRAELSSVQGDKDSLNERLTALQKSNEDLRAALQKSEDSRKASDLKVNELQNSLDKLKQEQTEEAVLKELESLKATVSQVEGERDQLRADWTKYLQQNAEGECSSPTTASGSAATPKSGPVGIPKPSKPQRVRLAKGKAIGLLIHKVQPYYPPLARQARIQGGVLLQAEISTDGTIQNLKVITGHPMLAPAAIEAVKQWLFKPLCLNGELVTVETQFDVQFTLAGG